jgi:hypothetical protein
VLWFLLLASSGVGIPVLLTMRIRVWPAKRRLGNGAPPPSQFVAVAEPSVTDA